jgi:hypothetical protein
MMEGPYTIGIIEVQDMTVTPWLANYPFSDPMFQNFQVQQYDTVAGVNPITTYDAPAPEKEAEKVETPEERKDRLDKELATLKAKANPTAADLKRIAVIEAAETEESK